MAANLGSDNDEPISEINVTPFVDIILVVLIIFMVTTPIIMKPSFNIELPKGISGDDTPPSQFSISIDSNSQILANGETVSEEQLNQLARNQLQQNPQIQAVIAADKSVPHGTVIGVIDAIKSAGILKFAISIDRK